MSTLKVNAFQDTSGKGFYPARVWVNWNGTGTVSIRNDAGISSVTDNGTGVYSPQFSNAFSAFDYAVSGIGDQTIQGGGQSLSTTDGQSTTTDVQVHWRQGNQGSNYDTTALYVVVHR